MSGMLGTKTVKPSSAPTDSLINFLNKQDTSNVDTTLGNLTQYASTSSDDLAKLMGDYTFNVAASDAAREQAQDAVYNQYMDRLTPQFERQTSDLQTRLANQGLGIGTEAYQRAMSDLQREQNDATNQAAYQSVLAGQQAYTQDLANQISAGTFGNQAQQAYINQLLSALQGSQSAYDVAMDKYAAQQNLANQTYAAKQQAMNNKLALNNSLISGGAQMAGAAMGASAMAASDIRLKENIKHLDTVDGVKIYEFNYIEQDERNVGVMAQEMQEVCPECVIENYKDSGYLGVDYSKLPEKVQQRIEELK